MISCVDADNFTPVVSQRKASFVALRLATYYLDALSLGNLVDGNRWLYDPVAEYGEPLATSSALLRRTIGRS